MTFRALILLMLAGTSLAASDLDVFLTFGRLSPAKNLSNQTVDSLGQTTGQEFHPGDFTMAGLGTAYTFLSRGDFRFRASLEYAQSVRNSGATLRYLEYEGLATHYLEAEGPSRPRPSTSASPPCTSPPVAGNMASPWNGAARPWSPVPNGTGASLSLPTTSAADDGSFYAVVATNSFGVATSDYAHLTVTYAPVIVIQPLAQGVAQGSSASFYVVAKGEPAPAYQWQVSRNGGTIWSNVASAGTSAAYVIPATAATDNGSLFQVLVSNGVGTGVTSVPVPLTLNAAALVESRELTGILARTQGKVVLMLDTCHAGGILGEGAMRGLDQALKLTRFINELTSAANGVMVFSSSTGRQLSLESPAWGNGAYTAIGDTVNTASRIEGLTKGSGYALLVSQSVFEQLGNPEGFDYLGEKPLKGRAAMAVYGLRNPEADGPSGGGDL